MSKDYVTKTYLKDYATTPVNWANITFTEDNIFVNGSVATKRTGGAFSLNPGFVRLANANNSYIDIFIASTLQESNTVIDGSFIIDAEAIVIRSTNVTESNCILKFQVTTNIFNPYSTEQVVDMVLFAQTPANSSNVIVGVLWSHNAVGIESASYPYINLGGNSFKVKFSWDNITKVFRMETSTGIIIYEKTCSGDAYMYLSVQKCTLGDGNAVGLTGTASISIQDGLRISKPLRVEDGIDFLTKKQVQDIGFSTSGTYAGNDYIVDDNIIKQ